MSIEHLLRRQAGVLTLRQAAANGLSGRAVRRRVQRRDWLVLHPGVVLAGGHRLTPEARIRAAFLWAGDRSTICGPAAAYRHGMLRDAPDIVDVTVPSTVGPRHRPGIRLRRSDLAPEDRIGLDGLWLTEKPLTALETALALSDGSAFLDRALQRHVRFPAMYRAYCRRLGRHGSRAAAALLVAAADRADSAAERLLVAILRDAGVTGWVLGHRFGIWRIDLAFPAVRVAIEVDGWAWHVDAERFANDRRKQNALVGAGWMPLRFTWHDLANRPDQVLASIIAAASAAG